MENPTQEIKDVVHALTQGSPGEQHKAIYQHFAPGASFEHPFCRVPSFKNVNAPGVGEIDSRAVITAIFRWYKILSPNIELNIESIAMDEQASILYLRIFQVFSIWFIPFYRVPVHLTTMLHLAPASEFENETTTAATTQPPPPYNATPEPTTEKHDAAQDKLHAVQEGSEPSYAAVASGEAAPPTPPAEQGDKDNLKKTTSHQQTQTQSDSSTSTGSNNDNSTPTRYLITKQEDLYQTSEFVKFIWLSPGASVAGLAQMVATLFCVFGVAAFGLLMQVLLPAKPVLKQVVLGGKY